MDIFKFSKGNNTKFKDIADKQCFYSGGDLYKKIFSQDLAVYEITSVNAISMVNGGLTKFMDDEKVVEAIMEHESVKN